MSNCTVSGNVATSGAGGALWLAPTNATIGSCTFHGNTGTAMYVNSGTVSVRATIFDESVACIVNNGTIVSQGYNIESGASCPTTTTDRRITNTQLVDPNLANNGGPTQTHAVLAGSPAIDAIPYAVANTANFVPSTDQRGVGRPQVSGNRSFWYGARVVDIGAFEYVLPTLTPY